MAYQETTTTSYGQQVGGSIKGLFSGLIFIILGTVLLWWNEGRAVKTADMLGEAQKAVVEVADVSKVDPGLNGKLIHATAVATTTDSVSDSQFGVGVAGALRVTRSVEFYQWKEESQTTTKEKVGGTKEETTTYTYKKDWTSNPVNSQKFKDPQYQNANFVLLNVKSQSFQAQNVTFGAYKMPPSMVGSIHASEGINIKFDSKELAEYNRSIKGLKEKDYANVAQPKATADSAQAATQQVAADSARTVNDDTRFAYVHESGNELYLGRNPQQPEVGDVRITFTKTMPREVTVVAQVNGGSFGPFVASNGKEFTNVSDGNVPVNQIFQKEKDSNSTITWLLRLVGLLIVVGGFKSMFSLMYMLFKFLPFLANIVEMGVSIVSGVLGFGWSLIVIAVAWMFYRPLLSISLLVIVAAVIFFVWKRGKDKKAVKEASQQVPPTVPPTAPPAV